MATLDPVTGLPQATPVVQPAQPTQPTIPVYQAPTYTPGQNFQFDPNQYLPQIQTQAASIYDPQKAQIQALQNLGQSKYEQSKITTNEQFDKELQARIEAINARGAFFGGGAIDQQNQIGTNRTRAINDLTMQNQADQAGFLAQQAGLNAAQAQYVQEKLSGAQNSAYSMWNDARNFATQQAQYKQQQDNWNKEFELRKKQIKAQAKTDKKAAQKAQKKLDQDQKNFEAEMAYKYASLNKGSGKTDKPSAYIDKNGNVVELPAGYNYVGGLSALNSNDGYSPLFPPK